MQQKHLFEYAVIRVVPRVEREEFLNIGVILFCPKQKFLQARYLLDDTKLRAFSADLDISELKGTSLRYGKDLHRATQQPDPLENWICLRVFAGLLLPAVPFCKPRKCIPVYAQTHRKRLIDYTVN